MYDFNHLSIEMVENGYQVWAGKSATETGFRFVFRDLPELYLWMKKNFILEEEKGFPHEFGEGNRCVHCGVWLAYQQHAGESCQKRKEKMK